MKARVLMDMVLAQQKWDALTWYQAGCLIGQPSPDSLKRVSEATWAYILDILSQGFWQHCRVSIKIIHRQLFYIRKLINWKGGNILPKLSPSLKMLGIKWSLSHSWFLMTPSPLVDQWNPKYHYPGEINPCVLSGHPPSGMLTFYAKSTCSVCLALSLIMQAQTISEICRKLSSPNSPLPIFTYFLFPFSNYHG